MRTGEASRGSCCSLARASSRASSEARELWMISSSAARLALNFSTVLRRFSFLSLTASLAMRFSSVPERKAERCEERARLVVRLRRGVDGDIHPAERVDLVVFDLRENDLLLHAEAVVAAAVERAVRHAAEVADARDGDVHQAIEKLVHARAAQRDHAADREVGADLEIGDRFARLGDDRLLARDPGHVGERVVEHLLVGGGLAHTHVDRDLLDARHLHHALVAVLLREIGHHLLAVVDRETRRRRRHLRRFRLRRRDGRLGGVLLRRFRLRLAGLGLRPGLALRLAPALRLFRVLLLLVLCHGYASTCSPFPLKMRTLRPSSSVFTPVRSAFCVAGLKSAILATWIGRSLSTMPPVSPFIGLGRWFFFTRFTPSTTKCSASTRRSTVPRLPLSRPAITTTSSPFLMRFITAPRGRARRFS